MNTFSMRTPKLRRSVLYVPADNKRALEKSITLEADCIIYDLEDAVAPSAKPEGRENLRRHFSENPHGRAERAIRINTLSGEWGTEDLMCARACMPDAIVLPKVDVPQDILMVADALDQTDAVSDMEIFAMIETAKGLLNITDISELGKTTGSRITCLIVGLNDLIRETRIGVESARDVAQPWFMQIILAARAGDLDVIDSVYNDFRDVDGLTAECIIAAQMGFDGKSLIHPAQIETANMVFMPSEIELVEAVAIVDAFRAPQNQSKGVIEIDGKMVELLHLKQAEMLLAKAAIARGALGNATVSEPPK